MPEPRRGGGAGAGAGFHWSPNIWLVRSVNPIPTGEGRLSPPFATALAPPKCFTFRLNCLGTYGYQLSKAWLAMCCRNLRRCNVWSQFADVHAEPNDFGSNLQCACMQCFLGLRSKTPISHIFFGNDERTDNWNLLSFGVSYKFCSSKIEDFSNFSKKKLGGIFGNYKEGIGI